MRRSRYQPIGAVFAALLCLASLRAWAQFTYTTNNGAITITGYIGPGGDVTIPSTINGYPVTTIETNAFYFKATVTSVTIPDSVTTIGSGAFWYCSGLTNIAVNPANSSYASAGGVLFDKALTTVIQCPGGLAGTYAISDSVTNIGTFAFISCSGLTNVAIGNSVISIGEDAFFGCSGLTNVTIGNSVTRIGDDAFVACSGLRNVTIGNSVSSIGDYAFAYCSALTNIAVSVANPSYTSSGGVLFNKTLTTLIEFPGGKTGNYAIPSSITSIGRDAFYYCSKLTSLTIPNSVTSIGPAAFSHCSQLINVTIGNGVFNISDSAFYYCSSLTNVVMGSGVTSIGDSAFDSCTTLRSVTIPNSITSIGPYAFYSCSSLTSVTIPNNVTSIGYYTFFNCSKLTNVVMGSSVLSIGTSAFDSCNALRSVAIPNSVTSIGNSAFSGCYSMTNATIGIGVTNIGSYAFAFCPNLHQAYFQGNAPSADGGGGADNTVFHDESGTVYYEPGTAGWGPTFGAWPTAGWYRSQPQILNSGYGLGAQSNGFQFTVSWATNIAVVVEASTNLQSWSPVITNTLVNGTNAFRDSCWTNFPQRFYRVRTP